MPKPSVDVPCRSLRASASPRLVTTLRAIAGLGAFPALMGVIASIRGFSPLGVLWALPLAVAVLGLVWLSRRTSLGAGKARIAGGRVYLEGTTRSTSFALGDIAWGARSKQDSAVDLDLRDGRRMQLAPLRPEDVETLLVATGTTVDVRAITVPLRGIIGPFVSGVLWFFLFLSVLSVLFGALSPSFGDGFLVGIAGTFLTPILSLLGAWLTVRMRQPRLTVGIDGLHIKMGFKERYVPHGEVSSVELLAATQGDTAVTNAGTLRITTASHTTLDLPIIGWSPADVDRIVVRMREAVEAQQTSRTDLAAEAFARGGRDVPAWRAEVLRAVSADGGFRTRRVSLQDAEGVLGDVAAPLEQRVGAAMALRASGAPGAAERIRVASAATADPNAARALAMAAAEEEDAALAELLADDARQSARRS